MLENNPILIIITVILYGITMKIADLQNEHGLKLFKGGAILFGIIWGLLGAVLVYNHNLIGNLILAMNIAFIIRGRLDYLNHSIATSIIIIIFLLTATISPTFFIVFYLTFLIFGAIKDYVDDILKKRGWLATLNESMLYYPIPTFIYCLIYGNWIIFWTFLLYTISYDLTKYIARRKGF